MSVTRRNFLGAASVVAVSAAGTGAVIASQPKDEWEMTAHIGYAYGRGGGNVSLKQKFVNTATGEEDWRALPNVPWNGEKPRGA